MKAGREECEPLQVKSCLCRFHKARRRQAGNASWECKTEVELDIEPQGLMVWKMGITCWLYVVIPWV